MVGVTVRSLRVIASAFVVTLLASSATAVCAVEADTEAADWTVLIYLDADNDLEKVGLDDFLDMSSIGSSENVNIVVQLDRISGYDRRYEDWSGTMRFLVEPGTTPIPLNAAMDLGELNMGDPDTLMDFISWGLTQYPADKVSLILWDHGGGWHGVCADDTSRDILTMEDVAAALKETTSNSGRKIDVLGYDACLMAMAEVMYETIEHVDYVVASEDIVPDDGWPYDSFLADLVTTPEMSPADLSETIVYRFKQSYGFGRPICLSAVDMAAAQDMYDAIERFAQELTLALPDNREMIAYCRSNTTSFELPEYVDLYRFAWNIGDKCTTSKLKEAADNLTAALEAAVIAEEHGRKYRDLGGVSVYFPESRSYYDPEGLYNTSLDFTADTSWDEFLVAYLEVGENMPPIAHMTWWPEQPEPGQEVFFSAEGSWDPDGWITSYSWDFGDNLAGYGLNVDHVYEVIGDYLVTLVVHDDEYELGFVSAMLSVG